MKGQRVKWRHIKEDGSGPVIDLVGTIIEVARIGTGWAALLQLDDGTFKNADLDNLVTTEAADAADDREAGQEAVAALEYLERHLEENFSGTNHGGGPIEWATSLLGELKAELITIGTERDEFKAAADKLSKELKAAKKKDPKPTEPTA